MKPTQAFVLFLIVLMPADATWAHGVVGDLRFSGAAGHSGSDPRNELDIAQPSWVRGSDGDNYSIESSIE